MERWKDKVAVVTGAASGIGAAVVRNLLDHNLKVIGLDFHEEKLKQQIEKYSDSFHGIRVDVTNENNVIEAFRWIQNNLGPIHALINCAGIVRFAPLISGDTRFWKEVLDTNVLGLCIATREAVKNMRVNNVEGHIVHISSTSGHSVPIPSPPNVYPASKHAVRALTETLRQELNSIGSKIKITSISPGSVETDIRPSGIAASGVVESPQLLKKGESFLQPEDVSDAILYALSTPPHVLIYDVVIKPIGEKC